MGVAGQLVRAADCRLRRKTLTRALRARARRSHLKAKSAVAVASLEKLCLTLFDICVAAQGHAFAQARAAPPFLWG